MARTDDISSFCIRRDRRLNGARPVSCRNPGGDACLCLNADSKACTVGRFIITHHHRQFQLLNKFTAQGKTYKPSSMRSHEIYCSGIHTFGRHIEVAFILPIFVINKNDHLSRFYIFNNLFNRTDCHDIHTFNCFSALLLKTCHKNKKSGECIEIRNLELTFYLL